VAWSEQFDQLAAARYPALLAYATLLAGSRAHAEDLVQDALLRTFSRPRRFPTIGHAEAYTRRAILSVFLDGHRRRATLVRSFSRVAERPVTVDPTSNVDDRDRVAAALEDLSPRVRACIVLRYYDDLTVPDLAHRLGISTGTAKRYLSEGAAQLRDVLATEDVDADAATVAPVVGASKGRRS
jgi:RNA polymerase sigma-70 factor (sigma-E family)